MKIAIAQIETFIGDFEKNLSKILSCIQKAQAEGCEIVVFPELSLTGYHPMDLLCKKGFVEKANFYLDKIKEVSKNLCTILGTISQRGEDLYNSAVILKDRNLLEVCKFHLRKKTPVYENLYFSSSQNKGIIKLGSKNIKIFVGEDIFMQSSLEDEIDFVLVISATSYREGKIKDVKKSLLDKAKLFNKRIIWVNGIFENSGEVGFGNSMVIDPDGIKFEAKAFEEKVYILDLDDLLSSNTSDMCWEEEVLGAITFGFKSYFKKSGVSKAVIGLSGGIDSSLCACLAKIAIGSEKLVGISMPGPFSSKESIEDAEELAKRLGIEFHIVPIDKLYQRALDEFKDLFKGKAPDITEENLQARLRAVVLMSYANKFNGLVINTGNKSESAIGYSTLYGDSIGAISLIGDLYKRSVYRLANYINKKFHWIPDRVLSKPPSAELRPDQKDEDDIPAYEILDSILELFLDKNLSEEEIIKRGFDKEVVRDVIRRFCQNEYKRKQAPFFIRISDSKFKRDMLPIMYKL